MFSTPEDLYLHSLDASLTTDQQAKVRAALEADASFARTAVQYQRLRQGLLRREADTFGVFFPETVVQRIRNLKDALDYQIILFVRRYQLAAWGILVALLILNLALADQLSFPSVMGMEETAAEEVLTFDFFRDLTH
jgi:hypothetical protein